MIVGSEVQILVSIMLSKEELLKLSDLAGEMSIMEYNTQVIKQHIKEKERKEKE